MDGQSSKLAARSGYGLELRGVSKAYGAAYALRSVDLAAPWGGALALFGHNGAGKTTLLRVAAALVKPGAGETLAAGFALPAQAANARAATGYVGHRNMLYPDLTPQENLRFYARLYGLADGERRAADVLRDAGAERWAGRRVRTLSNGMQKRVAVARALLHRPALLLLDEPDAGLDAQGKAFLEGVVRAVAEGGGAVVFATHDVERGLAAADRYAVLRGGRVAAEGSVADADPAAVALAVAAAESGA